MSDMYTFLLDVSGGTYISQRSAMTVHDALKLWMFDVDKAVLSAFMVSSNMELSQFINGIVTSQDSIVSVSGLKSVWFVLLRVREIDGFMNIVRTAA